MVPILSAVGVNSCGFVIVSVKYTMLAPFLVTVYANMCRFIAVSVKCAMLMPLLAAVFPDKCWFIIVPVEQTMLIPLLAAIYVDYSGFISASVKFTVQLPTLVSTFDNSCHSKIVFPTTCRYRVRLAQASYNLCETVVNMHTVTCNLHPDFDRQSRHTMMFTKSGSFLPPLTPHKNETVWFT